MPPSRLCGHQDTHQYLGPGCFCLLLEPLSQEPVFTEAAIYLAIFRCYEGEYIAECPKHQCGYLDQSRVPLENQALNLQGHSVPLERMYPLHGISVKEYLPWGWLPNFFTAACC